MLLKRKKKSSNVHGRAAKLCCMIKYAIVFWFRTPRTYLSFMENYIWKRNNSKYSSAKYNSIRGEERGLNCISLLFGSIRFLAFIISGTCVFLGPWSHVCPCPSAAWEPEFLEGSARFPQESVAVVLSCTFHSAQSVSSGQLFPTCCFQATEKVAWNPPTRLLNSKTW